MKERGILFSAPMVRALSAGTKTQTRRLLLDSWLRCLDPEDSADEYDRTIRLCPFGVPGDRLWVRETWQIVYDGCPYGCECWGECCCVEHDEATRGTPQNGCKHARVVYRATDTAERWDEGPDGDAIPMRWRSPLFLPRWASRLTLEIEHVRVQRLQDISEDDAVAEGCSGYMRGLDGLWQGRCQTPREAFAALWDGINGKPGRRWQDNPLVWAISFRVVPHQETINTQCHEAQAMSAANDNEHEQQQPSDMELDAALERLFEKQPQRLGEAVLDAMLRRLARCAPPPAGQEGTTPPKARPKPRPEVYEQVIAARKLRGRM
jgi:hypothetical protein